MAYGIQVDTTAGFVSLTTIRAMRRVHKKTCSSASGSYSPGASIVDNAIPVLEILDNKETPHVWINGNTVNWEPSGAGTTSTSFIIYLVKMV